MSVEALNALQIDLIPQPQNVTVGEGAFPLSGSVSIQLPQGASAEDRFAAEDLASELKAGSDLSLKIESNGLAGIQLVRGGEEQPAEGYEMEVTSKGVVIRGSDAAGLFWGTRTLLQSIRRTESGLEVPCMTIVDAPDIDLRIMHYDTKHHQDTLEYVQAFIRQLARYKANVLLWEWEDKFAYEKHPEIGAPGAFTKTQMQELTAYAQRYHVQIIPLVQGLGHVSYILKHRNLRHLREIPDSNWEFCPLKDESYDLLFDLWDEAMEATPGIEYCHIGTDETYELGLGEACGCKAKAEEIGREGLMQIFLEKCVAHVESRGRRSISWAGRYRPGADAQPPEKMVLMAGRSVDDMKQAQKAGYDSLIYAPNPGIEPLHLPYFPWTQHSMWRAETRRVRNGSFYETANSISQAGASGTVKGSVTTSWDDSGLHNQAWMPRRVCASEFSWNSRKPQGEVDVEAWVDRYFREYFGPQSLNLRELYQILQDGSVFYYRTFQRSVWHWGDVGKMHLPDLPRDEMEYNPFFQNRYAQLLHAAAEQKQRIARALWIIDDNLSNPDLRNRYDMDLYRTVTDLMGHNIDLILMLGRLEGAITEAHQKNYADRPESLHQLERGRDMLQEHLDDRNRVYGTLVEKWEETRLPKGLSTPDKDYVWAPDRARHLANRTPDMKYLIMDEELLGVEAYLEKLKAFIEYYRGNLIR